MQLYIRNMVCHRCKMAVEAILRELGLHPISIQLGEAVLEEKALSAELLKQLSDRLQAIGFELIDDKRSKLIEQIKTYAIELVHYSDERPTKKFSELLSAHLHHDYSYLSKLFSEVEGMTIEQFVINQRIEKVKELLIYDESSLSDIAFRLGYSSTAHLSNQFKKYTGMTPSAFKQKGIQARQSLDKAGIPK